MPEVFNITRKIHWEVDGDKTACGYWKPHALVVTKDPHQVTCSICLRNRPLREFLSPWPEIRDSGVDASLLGMPESSKRKVKLVTRPLTMDELQVFMDLILDKVPSFFIRPE